MTHGSWQGGSLPRASAQIKKIAKPQAAARNFITKGYQSDKLWLKRQRYFGCGISAATVASLPDFTLSYSSFTHGIFSALRSIQSGIGVRRVCLSSSANSTTTSSRV